jgi:hypothetical protein
MTAMRPDSMQPPAAVVRFAVLAVAGVEYAVDSSWVRRSLPAPDPLPAAIVHGGAAFQVIDLRQLFGLAAGPEGPGPAITAPCPERLILLVEQPLPEAAPAAAAAVHRVALVVDDLLGLEPLAAGAAVPLPGVYRGPERRWFRGVVPRADGRITVLLRPNGLAPAAARLPGGAGC